MASRTRRSRIARPDERHRTPIKIGGRDDYRSFKFPKSVSIDEIEARRDQLKKVYMACGGWNDLSNFVADHVRQGTTPVPLPPKDHFVHIGWKDFQGWSLWRATLKKKLPSIQWADLGESQINQHVLAAIRIVKSAEIDDAAEAIASIDRTMPSPTRPIAGSFAGALKAYESYVQKLEPLNFDRQGKIRQLLQRHADQPLATLGLDACRSLIDYWRHRPPRHDGKGRYSEKRSREQLRELVRFLGWLHLSEEYSWTEPESFLRLDRSISTQGKERKSVLDGKMPVFSLNDLATLVRNAGMPEKLWIVWCLNTSHGAAEVGRVQWEDLALEQDHPWRRSGLNVEPGGSWVGLIRPKTEVLGWWLLWPETVALLQRWKNECQAIFGREVEPTDPLIVRSTGKPLYDEKSKNAQAGFANQFDRLKKQCKRLGTPVQNLPPGTLRDQFPDWCGGDEGDATIASVQLAHGIPYKGDKLLYAHYANKPWRKLFEKQLAFREHCRPVLKAIDDSPPLHPKVQELAALWPTLRGKKTERVKTASAQLAVSIASIYRYLALLPDDVKDGGGQTEAVG